MSLLFAPIFLRRTHVKIIELLKISISTIHKKVLSICFNEKKKTNFPKTL
ncbi:hypothetical protein LEP1GSC041_0169 [Leptospira noguchii str. 2006001870]|nr:hypothetical protein LEP1GSC041_0169 [Leptospira noguchii str. 2006001870]